MNNNFNVRLKRRDGQTTSRLTFLNANLRRVQARMGLELHATSDKLFSTEYFVLHFGSKTVGTKQNNTARIILEDLVATAQNVELHPTGEEATALEANLFGESMTFSVAQFSILSIIADQSSSYVEYEVLVKLVPPQ